MSSPDSERPGTALPEAADLTPAEQLPPASPREAQVVIEESDTREPAFSHRNDPSSPALERDVSPGVPDSLRTLSTLPPHASLSESPPTEKSSSSLAPIPPSVWGEAARGLVLWILLAFALVTWTKLTWGKAWLGDFIGANQMDMGARIWFIAQILGGGALAAVACGVYLFLKRRRSGAPQTLERWGWFLSPLILLPAAPILLQHNIWFENHRALLPIVLFGALILELFLSHSLKNVPEIVRGLFVSTPRERSSEVPPVTPSRASSFLKKHAWLLAITTLGIAYGLFMSFYTIRWHHRLGTAIFDLGINNNLFAGGLHGVFNHSTVIFPDEPEKYWANHVKIGLYLFLPIYALIPKPETLLTIQSISLGLGAIPLFLFARKRLPEWGAFLIGLSYLCYYPMHGANFYEMKEPPTAAAFVLTMIWAMDGKHFKTGWVFFVLSMLMREDMPIPLAVIGAFFVLSSYRPRTGLVMAAIASIWFVFIRFKVMTDAGAWWFPNMYQDLWSEPEKGFRSVIKTLISNPTFVLKHIFVEKKFWYLMHLMVPVLFLPARRWYLWAAFIPGAILTLLITSYDPPLMFSFQYVMYWAPYLFVTAVLALGAIAKEHPLGTAKQSAAVVAMTLASLVLSYNYGAFPLRDQALQSGYHKIRFSWGEEEEQRYRDVLRMVTDIPKDASVAATERVGAHLSGRLKFYTLRRGAHGAEYLVARKSELKLDKTRETVTSALQSGEYGLYGRYGEFAVFKKGNDPKDNEAVLQEWGLARKKSSAKSKRKSALPEAPPEPAPSEADEAQPSD